MALYVEDLTSNNNDLTNSNGVAEVTANLPFAQSTACADFEKDSSTYLSIPDASCTNLEFSTTFTVEAWAKWENLPGAGVWQWIAAKEAYAVAGNRSWAVGLFNNSGTYRLEAIVSNGSGQFDMYTKNWTPTAGTWYHVAYSCDVGNSSATTWVFYVDGVAQGALTGVITDNISSIANGVAPFSVGCRFNGATVAVDFFDGQLDDVRIWSDVRTASEIADNRSTRLTGSEAGLVAYYPFEASSTPGTVAATGAMSTGSKLWGN